MSAERRELPWVKVDKPYVFDGPKGKETLADLFDGRSQLVVYHFMFGPGWEQGCPSCSWAADNIDGNVVHLNARDVTLVVVSRAPLPQIEAFKKRMGWRFKWVSSYGSDFNYDYHVSFTKEEMAKGKVYYNYGPNGFPSEEAPGVSVFYKDADGRRLPHLFQLRARRRTDARRLLLPRPRAEGSRRGEALDHGVGTAPRPVRRVISSGLANSPSYSHCPRSGNPPCFRGR